MPKCDKCKGTIGLHLWYTCKPLDNYFPSPLLLCFYCDHRIKHDITAKKIKYNPLIHARDLGLSQTDIEYCWKNVDGKVCKHCQKEILTNECGKRFNYGPEIKENRPDIDYFCLNCFRKDIEKNIID